MDTMETDVKKNGYHRTRLSMNTSLKNANIFDDDAWTEREAMDSQKEKMEITLEDGEIQEDEPIKTEEKGTIIKKERTTKIKTESIKEEKDVKKVKSEEVIKTEIKTEMKIKQEKMDDIKYCIKSEVRLRRKIKQEKEEGELEESFIDQTTISEEKMEITRGNKIPIKKQKSTEDTISNGLSDFALVTPIKKEIIEEPKTKTKQVKSVTRTIFTRNSPFKKEQEIQHESKGFTRTIITRSSPLKKELASTATKQAESVFNRLGPKIPKKRINSGSEENIKDSISRNNSESDKAPVKTRLGLDPAKKKRKKEMENDPETITRRQKQIEYGKNTLGYDNYIKTVRRQDRTLECPKTPDKFQKYSRRAWDGLIKQWRLKLHKYDPEGAEESSKQQDNKQK